jgi:SAM-dependent methyltransferase
LLPLPRPVRTNARKHALDPRGTTAQDDEVASEGVVTFRVAAEAYDRHVGRYGTELAAQLGAVAAVGPGQRVLDVGCGPGALTAVLAGLVGPTRVAAVDPSEPFAEACRARVPGADVRLGAAEDLPFADGSFDSVLSQLVVNFMTDPETGVAEMRRVARPGGVVASAVWDYAGGMTVLHTFWDAAIAIDPARAAPLHEGSRMRYCGDGELAGLWEASGLSDVHAGGLTVSADYSSFEDLWQPFAAGVGPSGAYFAALDDTARNRLLAEWHGRLGSPSGPFRLAARAWYAVGRA